MKGIVPDYYSDFHCIAEACRHSCCIGWEIDIDPDTAEHYRHISGELGTRLREGIAVDQDGRASFILDLEERCPFLNASGLCDLILHLGEESLCRICRDHPRYRSFFSDRVEIGLGLCCEAAAELIVNRREKMGLTILSDDGKADTLTAWEREVLAYRERMIETAQDRTIACRARMEKILQECGASRQADCPSSWVTFYRNLEQMDPLWDTLLAQAVGARPLRDPIEDIVAEQLLVYFLFRHLPCASDAMDLADRACFAVHAVSMIDVLYRRLPHWSVTELSRMYSSEIEYSEENTEELILQCRQTCRIADF